MKKLIIFSMAVLFMATLSLVGAGSVGWFGSDANATSKSDTAAKQANPSGELSVMSGTINENSQFVDDKGEVFTLASNEKGMEVKTMNGMKVEIKGSVMEKEGQKVVEVTEYNILK